MQTDAGRASAESDTEVVFFLIRVLQRARDFSFADSADISAVNERRIGLVYAAMSALQSVLLYTSVTTFDCTSTCCSVLYPLHTHSHTCASQFISLSAYCLMRVATTHPNPPSFSTTQTHTHTPLNALPYT